MVVSVSFNELWLIKCLTLSAFSLECWFYLIPRLPWIGNSSSVRFICRNEIKMLNLKKKKKKRQIALYPPWFPIRLWDLATPCVSCSVVPSSSWPHGLWLARLLCQWNSPGKNTGVGSHSLLERIFPTQESNLNLLHCRQTLLSEPPSNALLPFKPRL